MKINAYAAVKKGAALTPFTFDAPALQPHDVLVKVICCGLCHSDLHLVEDDWKMSKYPLVAGHEVVGKIEQVGSSVKDLKVGQRVAVGWQSSACLHCDSCNEGNTNLCGHPGLTCVGRHGGFADHIVVDGRFAFPVPDGLDSAHAAPLICAGATVYAPLRQNGVQAPDKVGIIGIGGLGHLAVQYAHAFGCEVTAIFTLPMPGAEAEAKALGAHHCAFLDKNMKLNQFDFILSTVPVNLDWGHVLSLLKPNGTLCFVGIPSTPATIPFDALIFGQRKIVGSIIANRTIFKETLEFSARCKVLPKIEKFAMKDINVALEKLRKNAVRYRAVLEF